jgi:hypothetical protein
VVDEVAQVRCVSGMGMIREEVWQDDTGRVAKYNLAFINHGLFRGDNGRVLGYDNAHGKHERHFKGAVEEIGFPGYESLLMRFLGEVRYLKEEEG